ncbi:hypothetical protein [Arthrobacter bambusae]|uniref:hypothetical protein n=1 Tax=Arthrobacter bambusae TaxID=1338426 RepID=UPI00278A5586|nr:hypothetical protein [Arthrobacter bambusae]MDQ0032035.1 hypothetical protein [Arthrobacter bambusae]MDQ0100213.1 hypothetical protein [Arthrobacter bambusae]
MKLFGKPQPVSLALLATGVALAISACGASPASTASQGAAPTSSGAVTAPVSPAPGNTSTAAAGASAAVGALVPGFPQQLIPLMPKAAVESSSFDKNSSPASVALVGNIASPADAVVAFYTSAFTAQGFKEVPGSTVGSIKSKDFLRGDNETVNISVVETAGNSTFTIGANVAAGSIK